MEIAVIIFTGIVAAISTYFANVELKQGPVRASALLSLLVALFFWFFPQVLTNYLTQHIPLVFFGASFIGMVSSSVLKNYLLIAVSGAVFSIIYLNTSQFFIGYGGGLGTTAAISLLFSLGIGIFSKTKIGKILLLKKRKKSKE